MTGPSDTEVELPPYRAVLVVDTERYGSNPDLAQQVLAQAVPDVLGLAFARCGLGHVWEGRLFPQDTGDGVGIGFDTKYLPGVIGRLFPALQEVLAERDVRLRERDRGLRLRLRGALHVGPVLMPGGGRALVNTHRLLEADVLRGALRRSDPDRTFFAVLLSGRVYDDVVDSGYVRLNVAPTDVRVKELSTKAYLHVPVMSGDLVGSGLVAAGAEIVGEEGAAGADLRQRVPAAGDVHNVMNGVHTGTAIQVGHLHGGLHNN
ncbi:hypothetical protein [Actinokineospora enzanensis]|uniref:hypothetical protein n=1 Tax=Actinokineospora enzanensis TaxID=155975 RepID=UPI00037850CB|nr:hypothetical protein [Actinokineospora enzanensis]